MSVAGTDLEKKRGVQFAGQQQKEGSHAGTQAAKKESTRRRKGKASSHAGTGRATPKGTGRRAERGGPAGTAPATTRADAGTGPAAHNREDTPMSNTNTNTAATTEISAEDRLAAKRAEEKALRAQLREAKVREGRLAKLRAYQAGEISDANPKGHHNPSLLPETLRKANEDEQIGKSHSHGWVVQIQCPTCSERVWINTQDAFQKTHCNEHAKAARRAANKDKRKAKALPDQVSAAEAKVAELKAQLAALQAG